MDLNDISGIGLAPVDAAAPAGADVREETAFDLLQNEISKMSNPAASSGVDWEQVIAQACILTRDKGKDIMVICYLAGGLLQVQGLPGLAAGLRVLDDVLLNYWESMFPPVGRLRARRNALQWLIDRIKSHSEDNDWALLPAQEPAVAQALQTHLKSIDALMAEKDGDAPTLRPLIALAANVPTHEVTEPVTQALAPAPLNASSPETVATSEVASKGGPSSIHAAPAASETARAVSPVQALQVDALAQEPVDSAEEAEAAATQAIQRLSDIAQWLSDGDLHQPQLYRFNRLGAWGGIEQLPQANGGKTHLPGPVPQVLEALNAMQARQSDEDLLRFAEAQLPIFPFWLDLNCIAAQALARLGGLHESARLEVQGATAWLVMRLPGIEFLAFANDVPFANAETRQWLQTLTSASQKTDTGQADVVQSVAAKARALAVDGGIAAAAHLLQDALVQAATPVQRFKLRTHLCELLLAERPGANLLPFARMLVDEIDRFHLTQWDPEVAILGLSAAWRIFSNDDDLKGEADALLTRLASIDVDAAVRLVT